MVLLFDAFPNYPISFKTKKNFNLSVLGHAIRNSRCEEDTDEHVSDFLY